MPRQQYADFAKDPTSTLAEDEAGIKGYNDGYSGVSPNFAQFRTNGERTEYRYGIKCGQNDKSKGLTNMYADDNLKTEIEEILAPLGKKVSVSIHNRYMMADVYKVLVGPDLISAEESKIIRKVKEYVKDIQVIQENRRLRLEKLMSE